MKTLESKTNRMNAVPFQETKKTGSKSKKEKILELWKSGQRDLWLMAEDLSTRPSYVASVLQNAGLIRGYYDLYTSPESAMNVYFDEFKGKLGFKDVATAERSIGLIEDVYHRLSEIKDRAGQHHCLVTALTMFNRARFIGKVHEAEVFRKWIIRHLSEPSELH